MSNVDRAPARYTGDPTLGPDATAPLTVPVSRTHAENGKKQQSNPVWLTASVMAGLSCLDAGRLPMPDDVPPSELRERKLSTWII
ncbi:hypothetical protein [Nocardia carnea]|uniref:hypothetical protein n=1 Tax=Nocardia carnea TaxID=37328 RepID=UPI002455415C|nr:hypothetical protein [Nocardia carnea]